MQVQWFPFQWSMIIKRANEIRWRGLLPREMTHSEEFHSYSLSFSIVFWTYGRNDSALKTDHSDSDLHRSTLFWVGECSNPPSRSLSFQQLECGRVPVRLDVYRILCYPADQWVWHLKVSRRLFYLRKDQRHVRQKGGSDNVSFRTCLLSLRFPPVYP